MWYTKKGDDGTTGLFGTRDRMEKGGRLFDALGTLDELNSLLGICRAHTPPDNKEGFPARRELEEVQQKLFIVQAELAGAEKTVAEKDVLALERAIETLESSTEKPKGFVLPGADKTSALYDYARAVARRTERVVLRARKDREVGEHTGRYLNRLSSFLYALARYASSRAGVKEINPTY